MNNRRRSDKSHPLITQIRIDPNSPVSLRDLCGKGFDLKPKRKGDPKGRLS